MIENFPLEEDSGEYFGEERWHEVTTEGIGASQDIYHIALAGSQRG
jgi:hypothetical protein